MLIYSNELPTGWAVVFAFETAASPEKRLEECGLFLCHLIHVLDAYNNSKKLPLQPYGRNLLPPAVSSPVALLTFLTSLLSSKPLLFLKKE